MELILVRHALPVRERGVNGAAADPGLAVEGREQSDLLARWLCAEGIDVIVSSPARRARQTAEPLADALQLPVEVADGLREFDTGAQEYVPVEELRAANDPRWQALERGEFYGCVDPAGFRSRVLDAADGIVAAHPGATVAAFTHAGVVNVCAGQLLGVARDIWLEPGYTSITRIAAARDGKRWIRTVNETPHLHPAYLRLVREAAAGGE